jgi:hypothetical protein
MASVATKDDLNTTRPFVKLIGVLNIVFGGLLMVCGTCFGLYILALPLMMPAFQSMQDSVKDRVEKQKQTEIAALEKRATNAETAVEKEEIRGEIAEVKAREVIVQTTPLPDFNDFGFTGVHFRLHYALEAATCLLLNMIMVVSGVGLVRFAEWGRRLGIWGAWLKIVRLGLLSVSLIVLSETNGPKLAKVFASAGATEGAAKAPQDAAADAQAEQDAKTTLRLVNWSYALGMLLIGSIYPAVTIRVLTRPGAHLACSKSQRQRRPGGALE